MKRFEGKVALITGGTSGIGRASAIAYAREGAKVVVAGRRAKEGEETVRLIRQAGGEGLFVQTDVTRENEVANLVDKTLAKFGRLDTAFNNAGLEEVIGPTHEKSSEAYDQIMDVNVKGLWLSMKHELSAMRRLGGGTIVNNASIAGLIGFEGAAIYCASKHAVIGLTRAAALENAKDNVRINAVSPGAIQTDMFERFAGAPEGDVAKFVVGMHPIGRMGTVEEIASAVLWLSASESSFVTGQSLTIDGGFTAR
jgi:NAD(P)-dependent dehydrogenase (short-subunit alcohol dehydrogenase family)